MEKLIMMWAEKLKNGKPTKEEVAELQADCDTLGIPMIDVILGVMKFMKKSSEVSTLDNKENI